MVCKTRGTGIQLGSGSLGIQGVWSFWTYGRQLLYSALGSSLLWRWVEGSGSLLFTVHELMELHLLS